MTHKKLVKSAAEPSKILVNDFFYSNIEIQIDNTEKDEYLPWLQCRGFLLQFTKRVRNWQIDDNKWALLRQTPFGKIIEWILELDINVEIVDALLGFWDEEHCGFVIGGTVIPFTVDDIAIITGLPNRGLQVVRKRARTRPQGQSCHLKAAFWTIILIEQRLDEILRKKDGNADKFFVQLMILYLWSSVMFPSSNGIVPQYMTYLLEDLDAIGAYNWAEALHSTLVKEVNAKFKLLKSPNEGKKNVATYFYGLYYIIHVWFFEHVNFGEDSRPSNPNGRPRMLKWVKACNFWQKKPFLLRLKEIGKDKVYLSLLPQDDEHELISQPGVERIRPQIEGPLGAMKGNTTLGRNHEDVNAGIGAGYEGIGLSGGQMEEEKKDAQGEIEASAEGKRLKKVVHIVIKQSEQIAALEKKVVKLEMLAASKGWNLEGAHDPDNLLEHKDGEVEAEVDEQAIDFLIGTIYESCMDERVNNHTIENGVYIQPGRNGPSEKKKVIGAAFQEQIGAMLSGITRSVKIEPQKNGKTNKLIAEEKLMFKRKRGFPNGLESTVCSQDQRLVRVEKDSDMLVNLDDYASPADHKKAKAEPLCYVGRELVTEDERIYLDAFCGKPMQRDDIVFFNWNIIIRRQSMVQYLQGGYTGEEIIDAYARILDERANMHGSNFASFLYVPPMFLGLYRNKLGSYKTFLNTVNIKSLEQAKFLFLPCHISSSGHWLLLVCDMDMKKWKVFNSLYDPRHREVAKEQMMLLTQYLFLDHNFDIRSWSLEYSRVYPQQEPGTLDCGVFVMKFMETIIGIPREITFQAADMRLFRPRIAYQILCHG